MASIDDIPGLEPETRTALETYKRLVAEALGDDFKGLYLFGSRAKGTHRPDSDIDVAVMVDREFRLVGMMMQLSDPMLAIYDQFGLEVQAWPLRLGSLEAPERYWGEPISRTVSNEGFLV